MTQPTLGLTHVARILLCASPLILGATGQASAQECSGGSTVFWQLIDYQNGFKSDSTGNDQVCAEQIVLSQALSLGNITIQGTFAANSVSNDFSLLIHTDAGGLPGAVIYEEHSVSTSILDTGVPLPPPLVSTNEYQLTLTPASLVSLPAGILWFEIYNNSPSGNAFFWLTGALDSTNGIAGSSITFTAPGVSFFNLNPDLAMRVCGFDPGGTTAYCFGDGSTTLCPCGNLGGAGEGCANTTGNGATLAASGTAQVGSDSLVLSSTQCPPGVPGLFFQGDAAQATPVVFGDGLRCVQGNIQRLGVVFVDGSGIANSLGSISVLGAVNPGDTKHYQFWYRDVGGPCASDFNTSHALSVDWQ